MFGTFADKFTGATDLATSSPGRRPASLVTRAPHTS